MKSCSFHPEALQEIDNVTAFYKEQQPSLEIRFLEALRDAVDHICRSPLIYRRVEGDVRKCRIMRFPYGVIYRLCGENIEVIAVMNLRRDPGYWRSRI